MEECLLKLLLTNDQCGALIGKGGSVITSLQQSNNVQIKAGSVDELFPRTPYRAVLIRGTSSGILLCLKELCQVLYKDHILRSENNSTTHADASNGSNNTTNVSTKEFVIRLLIPESSAGAIIGKQGSVIRVMCETSRATIRLTPPDNRLPGILERAISIAGSETAVASALNELFSTLAADPRNLQYANTTVNYSRLTNPHNPGMVNGFPVHDFTHASYPMNSFNSSNQGSYSKGPHGSSFGYPYPPQVPYPGSGVHRGGSFSSVYPEYSYPMASPNSSHLSIGSGSPSSHGILGSVDEGSHFHQLEHGDGNSLGGSPYGNHSNLRHSSSMPAYHVSSLGASVSQLHHIPDHLEHLPRRQYHSSSFSEYQPTLPHSQSLMPGSSNMHIYSPGNDASASSLSANDIATNQFFSSSNQVPGSHSGITQQHGSHMHPLSGTISGPSLRSMNAPQSMMPANYDEIQTRSQSGSISAPNSSSIPPHGFPINHSGYSFNQHSVQNQLNLSNTPPSTSNVSLSGSVGSSTHFSHQLSPTNGSHLNPSISSSQMNMSSVRSASNLSHVGSFSNGAFSTLNNSSGNISSSLNPGSGYIQPTSVAGSMSYTAGSASNMNLGVASSFGSPVDSRLNSFSQNISSSYRSLRNEDGESDVVEPVDNIYGSIVEQMSNFNIGNDTSSLDHITLPPGSFDSKFPDGLSSNELSFDIEQFSKTFSSPSGLSGIPSSGLHSDFTFPASTFDSVSVASNSSR